MNEIEWSNYKWIPQERWGQIHPEKSHWWYDPTQIEIQNNILKLKTGYNPKYFDELKITSNIGVGLVSCLTEFSYGIFEIEAKLPFGKNLWPAFWMYSWYSWPPEIDILEGYSDKTPNYQNKKSIFNIFGTSVYDIETNLHYRENETNQNIGGRKNRFRIDPTKNFIKYSCDWSEEHIRFYYDNILIREITDKKILSKFDGHKMNVIINNGVTSFVNREKPPQSSFDIKYFKYVAT